MVGVLLAGGQGRRMAASRPVPSPVAKGLLTVEGKRLIDLAAEKLKSVLEKVIISTNTPELYFYTGLPLVGDVLPPSGPMTGIYSAFVATGAGEVFVAACDMPFINPELIRLIINKRRGEATAPVFNGRPEPLLAVYSKALMNRMERMIKANASLRRLLEEAEANYIGEDEVRRIDPDGRSFANVNTDEDFQRARLSLKEAKQCSV